MTKQSPKSTQTTGAKSSKPARTVRNTGSGAAPAASGTRKRRDTSARESQRSATTSPKANSFLASKVTARSQTTLPSGVRKALGLQAGDRIAYVIEKDQVVMRKVEEEKGEEDPALAGFLDLLRDDIARNKERVVFATEGFADYLEELTAGIEVDYDAPIEGEFQL